MDQNSSFGPTGALPPHIQPRQELRQWCFQMAMGLPSVHAGNGDAQAVIAAAEAIEAYVAEVTAPTPVMKAA